VPAPLRTFLLTCETTADAIVAQAERAGVDTLQLVDAVEAATHAELRRRLPGVALVQVIHVTGEESVAEALRIAPLVDALLLDSGNPALQTKELGGTGRVHDWSQSRRIVEGSPVPVFLAGGLHPGNVGDAIRQVRPAGVDVCTGVRTSGRLDEEKLLAFCHAVRHPVSGIQ
jgi:phosphoribosylanthranilate isomerase